MIRVLIVDDSATARFLLRRVLESAADLQVAGEACTGEEALALLPRLNPDLITLDVNMPGMGGLAAIEQIMHAHPRPILVVTSLDSQAFVQTSFQALQRGALAVLAKPRGLPADDPHARALLEQARAMAPVKVIRRLPPSAAGPRSSPAPAGRMAPRLVAIGISTGGPPALQVILSNLRPDFRLPILIVQHLSLGFVGGLAAWLSAAGPLPCQVASAGDTAQPGRVYLAPDNCHLLARAGGLLGLDPAPPVGGHRPAVNPLFESVARAYGPAAIGVLLTGMGEDGAAGLLAMRQAGAYTIAQDETSSVVFGMPRAAILLGAAAEVLPLEHLAARLNTLAA